MRLSDGVVNRQLEETLEGSFAAVPSYAQSILELRDLYLLLYLMFHHLTYGPSFLRKIL